MLNPLLEKYLKALPALPGEDRHALLKEIAGKIASQLRQHGEAHLLFVCTHNSRRSQLAQVWADLFARETGLSGISCHSAGTEATAFHANAQSALTRAGFVLRRELSDPERIEVFAGNAAPLIAFSKRFDHASIPGQNLVAIMVCSDADENCPFISGAVLRMPLRYQDPKESDGSEQEMETYDARTAQIAVEMRCLFNEIANFFG